MFVSAGDGAAAVCDDFDTAAYAVDGIAVSGLASTPYNVAVGGTDFKLSGGTYFSGTNNATTGASALGYIPELVFNDSCGNPLFGTQSPFSGETPEQVCNNAAAPSARRGVGRLIRSPSMPKRLSSRTLRCSSSRGTPRAACATG